MIFSVVGLFGELKYNRRTFKNYLEIFIKSDIQFLLKKKNFYKKMNFIWGIDLSLSFQKNLISL